MDTLYPNEPVLGKENAAIHHPSQMNVRMFVGFDCEVNHFLFFFPLTLSDSVSVPVCLVWLHTCVCLLLFCPNTFASSAHMHELNYRLELCHDSLFSLNKKTRKSFASRKKDIHAIIGLPAPNRTKREARETHGHGV